MPCSSASRSRSSSPRLTEPTHPRPLPPEELGFESILYEKAPPRATITLNRPNVLNAFDFRMLRELARACEDASWDDSIRVVVLTGAGRPFCVGADLRSWADEYLGKPTEYWKWFGAFKDMHYRLREIGKPTVARINGICVGGGNEMQMACDLAVMVEDAFIRHVEREEPIATVLLNRPAQLNALSEELMDHLVEALRELDGDSAVRCIVLGGSERAFAAGADIGELADSSAIELYYARRVERWDAIRNLWTPLVAAVSGYCLGGGCELAMSCDLIVASETARFGQPETSLGIIPGAGGTQRLTRAVGKALAMDVILSGRQLSAREALAAGLVARVVAREAWLEEAKRVARDIASKGPVATRLAKEAVERAHETTLGLGLEYERRALYLAFASEDAKEGLDGFVEKRKPDFKGR